MRRRRRPSKDAPAAANPPMPPMPSMPPADLEGTCRPWQALRRVRAPAIALPPTAAAAPGTGRDGAARVHGIPRAAERARQPRAAVLIKPGPRGRAGMGMFVAATETGAGKTVVCAALARIAIASGALPVFFKPFMTDDLEDVFSVLASVIDGMKTPGDRLAMAPVHCETEYRLASQASPYAGTRGAGEDGVDVAEVLGAIAEMRGGVRRKIEEGSAAMGAGGTLPGTPRGEAVIVEGCGGAMTPIRRDYFVADLVRDAGMPAVVVTTNRIGALGLSAMTAEACRERGARPIGFVVNCTDPGGYDPARLGEDIREVTGVPVLASIESGGEPAVPARKGSMFGSYPLQAEGGMRREDMPEGTKRTLAAAKRAQESGALDGIARAMFEDEDRRARIRRSGGRRAA